MQFASGYRQRLPPALHRSATARPIPLRSKPPASAVWWRSNRSAVHCHRSTRSPPLPPQSGWHRRWRARHPLHCAFRRAPSHRDCRQAPQVRADKAGRQATGPFLLLSTQSADLLAPSEASASLQTPMTRTYLRLWRKIFHARRHMAVCPAAFGLSTVRQETDVRHYHRAVIFSARPIANRLAGRSLCSSFVL